jgi:Fe-S cluster assembly ATPase SufC
MSNGRIARSGGRELALELEQTGYAQVEAQRQAAR